MATTSLRQRRRRDEEEASSRTQDEDPDYDLFVQQYNIFVHNNGWGIPTVRHAAIFIAIIICTLVLQRIFDGRSSAARNDLRLLTVYPRSVSSVIHQMEGQTELLVTDDNREAISAIRTSIAMANNLRYNGSNKIRRKRRKGGVMGILLSITNFIASMRSNDQQDKSLVPGEVVLESYDDVKIRRYLVDHAEQCSQHHQNSNDPVDNAVLMRYDEVSTLMSKIDDNKQLDALWSYAMKLFTWCQLVNGDARGYLAHGTSVKMMAGNSESDTTSLHEKLDEARLKDIGIAVQQTPNDVSQSEGKGKTYGPLFVLPGGSASKELARRILYSCLSEDVPSLMHSNPLLFAFEEGWLRQWPAIESKRDEKDSWLLLESI